MLKKGKVFSTGAQILLDKAASIIAENRHSVVEYKGNGVICENSRDYDLTTRAGRNNYQRKCLSMVGYLAANEVREIKYQYGELPMHLNLGILEPWLSLYLLIDELRYQMETQDYLDEL